MPCRDYDSDNWGVTSRSDATERKLKAQADRLARIACKAMEALIKDGRGDFLLLKDDEVRTWWQEHQRADAAARAAAEEKARIKKLKEEALSKLSDDELIILGLKRKK